MSIRAHGKQETLGFNGFDNFSGHYYGPMSANDGYGGFDYGTDVFFMNRSTWTSPNGVGYQNGWCDTGYQNACHGKGDVWIYQTGVMESANLKETFSLKNMIAAASWSDDQPWRFSSYVYKNGTLHLKASDTIYIGQTAQRINFLKIDGKGAFENISAFTIQMEGYGRLGNTCNDGTGAYGTQLVLDDLKVRWNGKVPVGGAAGHHQMLVPPHLGYHKHPTVMPVPGHEHPSQPAHAGQSVGAPHENGSGAYHTQLLLLHHDPGLTGEFALPQPEHFGT